MYLSPRLFCFIGSLVTFISITRQIKRSKITIEDSLFWVLISALLLFIAMFPGVANKLSDLFGFQSMSNFVFCVMIGILFVREFQNTMQVSKLKSALNELVQEVALQEAEKHKDEGSSL